MKTHKFDVVSFLSGLVVTGIGLLFLIPQDTSDVWSFLGDIGAWFWPSGAARHRRSDRGARVGLHSGFR